MVKVLLVVILKLSSSLFKLLEDIEVEVLRTSVLCRRAFES